MNSFFKCVAGDVQNNIYVVGDQRYVVGVDREEGVEVDCFYLREELIRI
jgi:hypothetical protein